MSRYSLDRDIDALVCSLVRDGFEVERKKRHYAVVLNDGHKLTIPGSPYGGPRVHELQST